MEDKEPKNSVFVDAKKINGILNEAFSSSASSSSMSQESIEMTLRANGSNGFDVEKAGFESQTRESDDFLILTKVEKLTPTDFSSEVRPRLDAKHYFKDIQVLLDLQKLTTSEIMEEMIAKVLFFDSI